MTGVRVAILAEGQTEEFFIRDLLSPHLAKLGVYAAPTRICTKKVQGQRRHRGGHAGSYSYIQSDIRRLLPSHHWVTTMLDYYGLPADFPGSELATSGHAADRVLLLEEAFAKDIDDKRFLPNLVLHEFEALLFSDVSIVHQALGSVDRLRELSRIAVAYRSPEEINDSVETAPSKRLLKLYPEYTKPVDGPRIAAAIGLGCIRERCPHFHRWLCRLEGLAAGK